MFSTIILVSVLVGLQLASVVLWAKFLRLGLRWAKVPEVTTRRVILATALSIILQIPPYVLFRFVVASSAAQWTVHFLIGLAATTIIPCIVISTVFKARFPRALQAWLPTVLVSVTTYAFVLLVVRPFICEAFVESTNAMAPTLVGQHWKGTCPECGLPNYCSPRDERPGAVNPPRRICEKFHVTKVADRHATVNSGDCFLVAKFLTPRRWDLVVFKYPGDPAQVFAMRLVGLPGEKILIQGGSVWVDGKRQTTPAELKGLRYVTKVPGWSGPDLWGTVRRPVLLGKNEYFVLGDFSAQSRDSRLWQQGAPGHNPFAVPESYLKGVVTHTYWPPHRWRIHR